MKRTHTKKKIAEIESKINITLIGNILTKTEYLAIIIYVQIPE